MDKEKKYLLETLAKSMGGELVEYKDINDAIDKGISICIMVDTSSYISEKEKEKLKQKTYFL